MPRNPVTHKFQRATSSPSKRAKPPVIPLEAQPRVVLDEPTVQRDFIDSQRAEVVDEIRPEAETQLLARKFAEAVCPHWPIRRRLASTRTKEFLECPDCGHIVVEESDDSEG